MADRLLFNPGLEQVPDFSAPQHAPVVQLLLTAGQSEDEARETMRTTWLADWELRKERWAQQVAEEQEQAAADDAARQAQQDEDDRLAREADGLAEAERTKLQPKLAPVDPNLVITADDCLRPSDVILARLKAGHPVRFFYFTALGCEESKEPGAFASGIDYDPHNRSLLHKDRETRGSVPDRDLTMEQFRSAVRPFLSALAEQNMPLDVQDEYFKFFWAIEHHKIAGKGGLIEQQALMEYVDERRRLFHSLLQRGKATFSLGAIDDTYVATIRMRIASAETEANRLKTAALLREVEYLRSVTLGGAHRAARGSSSRPASGTSSSRYEPYRAALPPRHRGRSRSPSPPPRSARGAPGGKGKGRQSGGPKPSSRRDDTAPPPSSGTAAPASLIATLTATWSPRTNRPCASTTSGPLVALTPPTYTSAPAAPLRQDWPWRLRL
ncbi:hypothetical protein PsYK624_118470 [Phanerochaete sordida]|uniref:Uncharacterized protein n=1 Tax=Phanerochaete sordida TaxID=48140 RepID=A0A9P3GIN1_9APHY|nr:hypothetical protein PsYK624_118470 [Phanerochaete sordida]